MKRIILIGVCGLALNFQARSQSDSLKVTVNEPDNPKKVKYCNPSLEGMGRSKGIVVAYERAAGTPVESVAFAAGLKDANARISRNNKVDVKLRVPLMNKPSLKMVLGFRYTHEEFVFEGNDEFKYALYKNLEQKHLKTTGLNLTVLKSLNETRYVVIRAGADLNGDYNSKQFGRPEYLKYSFATIYGWKNCPTRTSGIGVYANYTLGDRSIYPVFLHNNTFNKHWGLEALLPASAKMRYNFSEKSLLYFGYEVDGASYRIKIDDPPLSQYPALDVRRSNVLGTVEYNQEIHDWLWFGITTGVRQPVSFKLTEKGDPGVLLVKNTIDATPFVNVSIFLVPPRTIENRIINAR